MVSFQQIFVNSEERSAKSLWSFGTKNTKGKNTGRVPCKELKEHQRVQGQEEGCVKEISHSLTVANAAEVRIVAFKRVVSNIEVAI